MTTAWNTPPCWQHHHGLPEMGMGPGRRQPDPQPRGFLCQAQGKASLVADIPSAVRFLPSGLAVLLPPRRTLLPAHQALCSPLCLCFGAFKKQSRAGCFSAPHLPPARTGPGGAAVKGRTSTHLPQGKGMCTPCQGGLPPLSPPGNTAGPLCSAALLLPGHKATPCPPWEKGLLWAAWIQRRLV